MPASTNFRTAVFLILWFIKERKNTLSIAFVVPRRRTGTARVAGKIDTYTTASNNKLFVMEESTGFNDISFEDGEFDGIEELLNLEDDELDEQNLNYDGQYEIYKNRLLSDDIMLDYEVVLQDELPGIIKEEINHSKSSSKQQKPERESKTKKKNKSSPMTIDDLSSLTTTKGSDISYFYLKNELNLPEEYMWKITNENGSLLGMTAANLRNKVQLLRSLMDLSSEEVRYMVMRMPAVLQYSAKGNVAPTTLFLQRSFDLSRKDLKRLLLDYPSILGYSMQNLKTKFNFYLKLCGFTKEEARKMFLQEPKLLTAGVRTGLVPRMHFLVKELEFPLDVFREIVKKNPLILLSSLDMNLRPKLIFYLILNVGLDVTQVQKLLRRFPQFTNNNLDNKILPLQRYFCEEVDFSVSEYGNILLKNPHMITSSLYKIKHVVGYLRYELELDSHQVKRILYQAPQVMNLNTEDTLKNKINYLQSTLNLTNDEMKRVLTGMPTLLLCSIENNIQPKLDYLYSLDIETKEVSEMILLLPTMMGYSLEKRIKPRMEKLIQAKVPVSAITVALPVKESYFESWLKGREHRAATGQVRQKHARVNKTKRREPAMRFVEEFVEGAGKKETNATKDGRIQHWTRPRKYSLLSED